MSLRSATRLAARSARSASASFRAPVVARRAASSGGHKGSSDLPWALGSAVVFIPLGAYVMSSRGSGHGADHSHDHPAENQAANQKTKDQHGNTGMAVKFADPKGEENEGKAEGNKGGADNAENAPGVNAEKQAAEQAEAIDSPKEAMAVEEHGGAVNKAAAAAAGEAKDKKDDLKETVKKAGESVKDKASELKENVKKAGESAKDKAEDVKEDVKKATKSGDDESSDDKSGDEPSEEAIKDSLHQAESIAVPRAAMAQEEDDK